MTAFVQEAERGFTVWVRSFALGPRLRVAAIAERSSEGKKPVLIGSRVPFDLLAKLTAAEDLGAVSYAVFSVVQ